jgi:hypothetical protein
MTKEVFERISALLNENGVLCFVRVEIVFFSNFQSFVGYKSKPAFKSAWKTISQVFPNVRAFKAGEDEGDFGNMVRKLIDKSDMADSFCK